MKPVIIIAAFLLFLSTTFTGAEMRIWTSTAGSTMEAELIDFKNRVVILKSSTGKKITLQINQLELADQGYIKNWTTHKKALLLKNSFIQEKEIENSVQVTEELVNSVPSETLCKSGELIVSTAFDQPTAVIRKGPINNWKVGKGEWRVEGGVLHGDELPEDNHASSCTFRFGATDMIIKAQFKLGDAKFISFGCRDNVPPNLHLARTFVSSDSIWIQRMSGIAKTTKAEKLATYKTSIDPNSWHHILIEILGDHYRVTVGDHTVEAHHERFQDTKGILALITKGQGAQFKNVSIWHAEENR